MLITFNKSGSLANIDFQYDSFSQGDNNVHIVDVIIDDESFNNLDYNGYVQFLREGETTPSPKLIMTPTAKGYTFKMNTDWYTAIAGTLKMTIEIKQYDENGLQSNKAFGVVNIPVMESVSGGSEVETTITNEEYLALVNLINEKANENTDNLFTEKQTFLKGVLIKQPENSSSFKIESTDLSKSFELNNLGEITIIEDSINYNIKLPKKGGVIAMANDLTKINGLNQMTSPNNQEVYAPITAGSNGYLLQSSGENIKVPNWVSPNELRVGYAAESNKSSKADFATNSLNADNLGNKPANEYATLKDLSNISSLRIEIVSELPTENISTTTIYLKSISGSDIQNVYEEYIYVNSNWELIGNTKVDLSDYYTKTEINNSFETRDFSIQSAQKYATDALSKANQNASDISNLNLNKVEKTSLGSFAYRDSLSKTDVGLDKVLNVESYSKTEVDKKFSQLGSETKFTSVEAETIFTNQIRQKLLTGESIPLLIESDSQIYLGNDETSLFLKSKNKPRWYNVSEDKNYQLATLEDVYNITDTFKIEVVEELPDVANVSRTTIYLKKSTTTGEKNIYNEYIYTDDGWELIGTTDGSFDLSNYYSKTEVDNFISDINRNINNKIDASLVYTKLELDSKVFSVLDSEAGNLNLVGDINSTISVKNESSSGDVITSIIPSTIKVGETDKVYSLITNHAFGFFDKDFNERIDVIGYTNGYKSIKIGQDDVHLALSGSDVTITKNGVRGTLITKEEVDNLIGDINSVLDILNGEA